MEDTDYISLRDELLAKSPDERLFVDVEFPATEQSLGFENPEFVWKRPKEICALLEPGFEPEFFVDGRSRADVRQGNQISNCWVVAAAACLSSAKQDVFDRVVPPDQGFQLETYCGAFHFNFWRYGTWVKVIVDDRLPTINGKLAFIYSTAPNEFWGALLEKAYAKLHGNYKNLEIGHTADALADFTGGLVEHHFFDSDECCPVICNLLKDAFHSNSLATVATQGVDEEVKTILDNGLITNHAYSVTQIQELVLEDENLLTCYLVNPWGEGLIFKGDCVDGSSSDIALDNLNQQNEKGGFWIKVQDVVSNFHSLELCYNNLIDNSTWNKTVECGFWDGEVNSGGGQDNENFYKNPQLLMDIKYSEAVGSVSEAIVIVELTQIGRREANLSYLEMCFYVFDVSSVEEFPLTAEFFSDNNSKCGLFDYNGVFFKQRAIVNRYKFSEDTTIAVIPATPNVGQNGKFMLRILSNVPLTLKHFYNRGNQS